MKPATLNEEMVESLASIEHERWAHWQRFVHDQCLKQEDGSLVIPAKFASRWNRQMETPFEQLTEAEKESDREQVRRYLPLILYSIGQAWDAPGRPARVHFDAQE